MHAPFIFSSTQPYPPVAIANFLLFRVCMERCPSLTLWFCMPHFSCLWKLSPLQAHWGRLHYSYFLRQAYLFTAHVREYPPHSGGAFHTTATVASFPHSKVAGRVQPLLPFPASLFIYSSCGECLSDGACHTLASVTGLPLSKRTGGGGTTPAFLAGVCIYSLLEGAPSPTLWSSGRPVLSATCLFFSAAVYYSVWLFLFFPWVGSVSPGAMLIWPRVVCGSTVCHLAHLVCFSQAG
jgi:hypothetical protein